MRATPTHTRRQMQPAGMTLLEVLVASGILVIGLVSVAALLPAAGSRLAEATLIDRAGTLSANCYADIWNRGILTASLAPATSRGVMLIEAGMQSAMFAGVSLPLGFQAVAVPDQTFQLPDNLQWDGNVLVSNDGRVSSIATVIPLDRTTAGSDGGPFRLSIAIFRRTTSVAKVFVVTNDNGGVVFRVESDSESDRKRYFPPCGWVLVTPAAVTGVVEEQPARWLHIASSWSVQGVHYVRFTDHALANDLIFSKPPEVLVTNFRTAQIYGFSQLVRVDERSVVLE